MACCILLAGLCAILIALQAKILNKQIDCSSAVKWRLEKKDHHESAL